MHKTNKIKQQKEKNNQNRGFNNFNTGTRTMKSPKDYRRKTPIEIESEYRKDNTAYGYEM